MKVEKINWERKRAEDPLTMMRRPQLQALCRARGIEFSPSETPARELRALLRKAGYGHENAT